MPKTDWIAAAIIIGLTALVIAVELIRVRLRR